MLKITAYKIAQYDDYDRYQEELEGDRRDQAQYNHMQEHNIYFINALDINGNDVFNNNSIDPTDGYESLDMATNVATDLISEAKELGAVEVNIIDREGNILENVWKEESMQMPPQPMQMPY